MSTQTLERPAETLQHDGPKSAHIVKPQDGVTGAALVTHSRVFGTEVEALCGHRFVVTRDPKALPLCDECKRLFDEKVGPGWEPEDA